jgi:hypothetical protein
MANFVEFLKSGKSAREFIDTAILPQHVLPVERTEFSPEPYEDEELNAGEAAAESTDDVLDSAPDNPPESPAEGDKAADLNGEAGQELIGSDEETDPAFIAALEAAERKGL